jgi:hypothetical protein
MLALGRISSYFNEVVTSNVPRGRGVKGEMLFRFGQGHDARRSRFRGLDHLVAESD